MHEVKNIRHLRQQGTSAHISFLIKCVLLIIHTREVCAGRKLKGDKQKMAGYTQHNYGIFLR